MSYKTLAKPQINPSINQLFPLQKGTAEELPIQAPVLLHPQFKFKAEFSLQTNTNVVCLGAVHEEEGKVFAYASQPHI